MQSDEDGYFGEDVASRYDAECGERAAPEVVAATVGFLAARALGGRALELGVGTGRIALPLAARGVPVHGIDLSRAMLERLRAKPGGRSIGVTCGDLATTRVEGAFSLVYLVFNTIMNLTTQDAQIACFENAAAHLAQGGCFVVEVMLPELRHLPPGTDVVPLPTRDGLRAFDRYDIATQALSSNYERPDGSVRSIPFRYVWPAELDLMARLAGLRLRERWAGWDGAPFTHESAEHVSVWETAPR